MSAGSKHRATTSRTFGASRPTLPPATSLVCFSERIVEAMSTLLQDEVTLFHRKLVMKDRESSTDAGWDAGNAWEVSACPRCPPARARAADDVLR